MWRRKKRKFLTVPGRFHLKSRTLRQNTEWKEGGQGLVSIGAANQDERRSKMEHLEEDELLSEHETAEI